MPYGDHKTNSQIRSNSHHTPIKPKSSRNFMAFAGLIIILLLGVLVSSFSSDQEPTPAVNSQPAVQVQIIRPTPVVDNAAFQEAYVAGVAKYQKGDNQGAKVDFTRAIQFNPGSADAYQARATVEQQLGQKELAKADFAYADSLRASK